MRRNSNPKVFPAATRCLAFVALALLAACALVGTANGQTYLGVFYESSRGGLPKDDREAAAAARNWAVPPRQPHPTWQRRQPLSRVRRLC